MTYTFNLVGSNSYLWNLNHNKTHHSFPNIADFDLVHYIALSEIIKQTAEEFEINYHKESMWGAIVSLYKLLKRMGSTKIPNKNIYLKMN